jgi:hypothetical protein
VEELESKIPEPHDNRFAGILPERASPFTALAAHE